MPIQDGKKSILVYTVYKTRHRELQGRDTMLQRDTCYICCDDREELGPTEVGACACRFGAHAICRANAAAAVCHLRNSSTFWKRCEICNIKFSGKTRIAAAEKWVLETKHLPQNHTRRLDAEMHLAMTCKVNGDFARAWELAKQCFGESLRAHGSENERTWKFGLQTAQCLAAVGRHNESAKLQKTILETQRGCLGMLHPLVSQNTAYEALLHEQRGEYNDAVKIYKDIDALYQNTRAHMATETYVNLLRHMSRSLAHAKKFEESFAIQEKASKICRQITGTYHSLSLKTEANFAKILHLRSNFKEAVKIWETIAEKSLLVNGEFNIQTLKIQQELASSLFESGSRKQACDLFFQISKKSAKQFGNDHQQTLESIEKFADSMARMDHAKAQEKILRYLLQKRTVLLGRTHEHTLQTKWKLAYTLHKNGNEIELAVTLAKSILDIQSENYPPTFTRSEVKLFVTKLENNFGSETCATNLRKRTASEMASCAT